MNILYYSDDQPKSGTICNQVADIIIFIKAKYKIVLTVEIISKSIIIKKKETEND